MINNDRGMGLGDPYGNQLYVVQIGENTLTVGYEAYQALQNLDPNDGETALAIIASLSDFHSSQESSPSDIRAVAGRTAIVADEIGLVPDVRASHPPARRDAAARLPHPRPPGGHASDYGQTTNSMFDLPGTRARFLSWNLLSSQWKKDRIIVALPYLPFVYLAGMVGYALALPCRVMIFVITFLLLIGKLASHLCRGEFSRIPSHMKQTGVVFLGATGKLVCGVLGVVCPPLAYQFEELIESNRTIHQWYYDYTLSRWNDEDGTAPYAIVHDVAAANAAVDFGNGNEDRLFNIGNDNKPNAVFFIRANKALDVHLSNVESMGEDALFSIANLGYLLTLATGKSLGCYIQIAEKRETIDSGKLKSLKNTIEPYFQALAAAKVPLIPLEELKEYIYTWAQVAVPEDALHEDQEKGKAKIDEGEIRKKQADRVRNQITRGSLTDETVLNRMSEQFPEINILLRPAQKNESEKLGGTNAALLVMCALLLTHSDDQLKDGSTRRKMIESYLDLFKNCEITTKIDEKTETCSMLAGVQKIAVTLQAFGQELNNAAKGLFSEITKSSYADE